MPLRVKTTAGGEGYSNPFVGPINHTLHVKLDLSTFTTDEVDAYGYIKPGTPIALLGNNLGTRIGIEAAAGSAVAAAVAGNTGNGAMGAITVSTGAKAGVYTLTIIEPAANAGAFVVTDPDGIVIGNGDVAAAFSAGGLAFTLADGATDFAAGDQLTITVTLTAGGATTKALYGAVVEATPLILTTIPPTNGTLATETADHFVAVAMIGVMNRDIAEDNLGRALTAAELAAFASAGCNIALTTT